VQKGALTKFTLCGPYRIFAASLNIIDVTN